MMHSSSPHKNKYIQFVFSSLPKLDYKYLSYSSCSLRPFTPCSNTTLKPSWTYLQLKLHFCYYRKSEAPKRGAYIKHHPFNYALHPNLVGNVPVKAERHLNYTANSHTLICVHYNSNHHHSIEIELHIADVLISIRPSA